MKFYDSKVAKFLAGKGFYFVLAVCIAVIGVAAYSAMDSVSPQNEEKNSGEISEFEKVPSAPVVPQTSSKQTEVNENSESEETTQIDTEEKVPYFVLPIGGSVTKGFSETSLQYSKTFNDMRVHLGTDITPEFATVVVSAAAGEVLSVEENTVYGTVVTIDHGDGIVLKYCGIKNVTVTKGDVVSVEEIIGEIGIVTNECADKEHLHLELLINGAYSDPMTLFMEE